MIFQEIADILQAQNDLYTKPHELAAIWTTDNPIVVIEDGQIKTVIRLTAEQLVKIKDGELANCYSENAATHKINKTFGTLVNQFELHLISLTDNSELIIKI